MLCTWLVLALSCTAVDQLAHDATRLAMTVCVRALSATQFSCAPISSPCSFDTDTHVLHIATNMHLCPR
jgi:hypothetical protein